MFGYVCPPLGVLPEEEQERFREAYCGLCHTLGRRFGFRTRFILNYDFTFLAILFSDGQEPDRGCARCVVHPCRKRHYQQPDPALELAADESVILAYWQLRDGVADHGFWKGLQYRFLSRLLRGAYRKAAALRPDFDAGTREQLRQLSALEAEQCPSMDRAADAFAALLGGAAKEVEDPIRRRVLEQILYHLGRWIYLVDAADDLKKDARSGDYNPVALRYGLTDGTWTAESRHAFALTLDHSVHMMATAFELWDFGRWQKILESTLYTGLFSVGAAVLNGTFRASLRGQYRKKRKNVRKSHE
ncbi:DUF5685 family protein [Dysosmobacter sp.]|uniref:DUF5685 family protein n=1 Tax=Dysosmobacter sp. TaxID=2591382 RepID=UPI002A8B88A3|nr:DUF5685 family protein [Dysosmobacter sp.]MDY3282385.1 DUF5685 family protein [Dysosmobacter sp.]